MDQKKRLSLGKKLLFSLVLLTVLFLLVEGALALVGVRSGLDTDDPFVGFAATIPLFVASEQDDDRLVMETAANKRNFFNQQRFFRDKQEGAYRIFCVGGSTTYGRPYGDATAFSGWLREFLPSADPSRNWEVINAGGISYASYRVAALMEELAQYQPDLFIIYSGHNEFLEERTYGKSLDQPAWLIHARALLNRSRLYSAARHMINSVRGGGKRSKQKQKLLAGEVEAILDETVGPSAYTRDALDKNGILRTYLLNLTRMAELARSVGAEAVFVTPASKLRDCLPFKAESRAGLTPEEAERFAQLFDQGERARAEEHFDKALAAFDEALRIDNRHALLHFRRGETLFALSRFNAAREAFRRARDEDICPLRALTEMKDIVVDVARSENAPLVDYVSLIDERSEHRIPGDDFFLDHVHPTIDGNRILALEIIEVLTERGIVRTGSAWNKQAIDTIARRVEGAIDRATHVAALVNLARVLAWAGKNREAYRLALRALELVPDDPNALGAAGINAFRLDELEAAESHYRKLLSQEPGNREAHHLIGNVLSRLGQHEDATGHYREALQLDPVSPESHLNRGLALVGHALTSGESDLFTRAIEHYEEAIRLNPNYVPAHSNLALETARQGKFADAITHYQSVLRIQPDSAEAQYGIGLALAHQGKLEEGMAYTASAMRIRPDAGRLGEVAWLLATHKDPAIRDGARAVQIAAQACQMTGSTRPSLLDTLAAAYAEVGRFDEAAATAKKAIDNAVTAKEGDLTQLIQRRRSLYLAKTPYRE